MSLRTIARRCAVVLCLTLIGVSSSASAHVTVSSPDAEQGGWAKIVFRVPTESDTASTMSITVELPEATPFASVSTQPKAGWSVSVDSRTYEEPVKTGDFALTEAAASVTWTATGAGIKPGEFDEFALSVGPLPESDTISFSVSQLYSDKTTANWDQVATSGEEADHPAPTLALVSTTSDSAASSGPSWSDRWDSGIAIAALVLAAVALALGLRNNGRNA